MRLVFADTPGPGDVIARSGTDEFTLVTPVCGPDIQNMIDRIDRDLADEEFETPFSISAGVSSYPDDGSDAETLLEKADDRMSEAKRRKKFLHAA